MPGGSHSKEAAKADEGLEAKRPREIDKAVKSFLTLTVRENVFEFMAECTCKMRLSQAKTIDTTNKTQQ